MSLEMKIDYGVFWALIFSSTAHRPFFFPISLPDLCCPCDNNYFLIELIQFTRKHKETSISCHLTKGSVGLITS